MGETRRGRHGISFQARRLLRGAAFKKVIANARLRLGWWLEEFGGEKWHVERRRGPSAGGGEARIRSIREAYLIRINKSEGKTINRAIICHCQYS